MTDLTAREVVEKLHQYDDLLSFPKINIHFLATAPGNEHLLKKGRKATGYWPIREDMANAGATVLDQPVVVDENVITSRFIYDIPQFVDAIVAQLN